MHENVPDGAHDLNRSLTRTALALGGRLGEILARQRAEHQDQMLRAAAAERRRLQERFEAERAVMRTELAPVHQDRFWEAATPEQVGERYAQARHWEAFDDMARASRQRMEHEITTRYDLSPEEYLSRISPPQPGPGQSAERRSGPGQEGAAQVAETERLAAAVARGDAQNDLDTQTAAAAAGDLWDSAARREEMAENLRSRFGGTPAGRDGTEAVLAADRDNGTHPVRAVQEPGGAATGRKFAGRGQDRTRELGRG